MARTLRIELLRFKGCPGFTETLSILERVVAEEGLAAKIVPVTLGFDELPDFPGNPTILVDGEDLFPAGRRGNARAMNCRIYPTPEGSKNYPTAALVRGALVKRSSRE